MTPDELRALSENVPVDLRFEVICLSCEWKQSGTMTTETLADDIPTSCPNCGPLEIDPARLRMPGSRSKRAARRAVGEHQRARFGTLKGLRVGDGWKVTVRAFPLKP